MFEPTPEELDAIAAGDEPERSGNTEQPPEVVHYERWADDSDDWLDDDDWGVEGNFDYDCGPVV